MKNSIFAILLTFFVLFLCEIHVSSGDSNSNTSTTESPSVEKECEKYSGGSCNDCVKNVKCFYCESTKKCEVYPYSTIVPKAKDCTMSNIRWGQCVVNFLALIISCAVIGGVIIISITICCCCCCCKNKKNTGLTKLEMKWERQKEERKTRNEERRADRKVKTDEIRKKYGLLKDDNPYEKLDA